MPRRNQGARLRFLDKRGSYYITWTEHGRSRERSTGTADREQAEIALAEFIHQRTRAAGPRDPAETLITDALADYALEQGPRTAAPWRIGHAIDALTRFWEGRTVAEITRETCGRYVVARGRSSGTSRRELGVLRAAIHHAHREGRLTRTVAVHLPDGAEPRDRWLTRDEAAGLLRAALREPRVRLYLPLYVLISIYTGARKEAIPSLRWSQVDLSAGRIDFNPPGSRRTNKRRARIPIPSRLLPHLRRARQRGTEIGFVIHENGARLKDVKKGFASACRRAGLQGVSPHTLRHTAATWLMQAGIEIWEASGYLGMSPETLQRVYAHHHPDHLREPAEALSGRPRNVRATRRI
jgi:integrase